MHRPFAFVALLLTLSLPGCGGSSADEEFDELEGKRHAVRFFQAELCQRSILTNEPVMDEREIDLFRRTQVFLIESDRVLESALRHVDLAEWDAIPEGEETLDWVRERLVVRFRDGSEVLQIALVDRRAPKEAMVAIVEAISKAYLNEVVFESKIQRQKPRDILSASYRDLDEEIRRKTKAYQALLKEASSARLPEVAVKVELMKQQFSRLQDARIAAEEEYLRRLVEISLAEPPTEGHSGAAVDSPAEAPDQTAAGDDDGDPNDDERDESEPVEAEEAESEDEAPEPSTANKEQSGAPMDDHLESLLDDVVSQKQRSDAASGMADDMNFLDITYTGVGDEFDALDELGQNAWIATASNLPADKLCELYRRHIASLDARIDQLCEQIENSSRDDPGLAARAAEIEQLKSIQAEITEKIEHWDIELKMPNRITEFGSVEFHEP